MFVVPVVYLLLRRRQIRKEGTQAPPLQPAMQQSRKEPHILLEV
jgi:hypothetical protein